MNTKCYSEPRSRAAGHLTLSDAISHFLSQPGSAGFTGARSVQRSVLGDMPLRTLSKRTIRLWCEERLSHVSLSTVTDNLRLMRLSIELARKELGVKLPGNPASEISLNEHDRRLSVQEVDKLYAALAAHPVYRALVIVAVETGLPRGALTSVRWKDIDFTRSVLRIRKADSNGASDVALSALAVEALQTLPHQGYRVFPILVDQLRWVWTAASRRAGLKGLKFFEPQHVLRREQSERP